jgi:hypothetical protein
MKETIAHPQVIPWVGTKHDLPKCQTATSACNPLLGHIDHTRTPHIIQKLRGGDMKEERAKPAPTYVKKSMFWLCKYICIALAHILH